MKVAIVSDSHDNIGKVKTFVEKINSGNEIDLVIHCGDIISPFTANLFNHLKPDFIAVFGNNDGEKLGLLKTLQDKIHKPPKLIKLKEKKAVILHEPDILEFIEKSTSDYVFTGHTHKIEIKKIEKTLIINPGELCGYLTGKSTFVILNTETNETVIEEV